MTDAVQRLSAIESRIAAAAAGSRLKPVQLIAVSKTFEAAEIRPILAAGQRIFGENRVQEAQNKWPQLRGQYPEIELHLIGPLQSNKAAEAVAIFDVIQTIDRLKIAKAVAAQAKRQARMIRCFVQINTGLELQKAGVEPAQADQFISEVRDLFGAALIGLMCIPPQGDDPRPHFKMLKQIAERNKLRELSMGMSSDFEVAISEGASFVRVGSAIFGQRPAISPLQV